MIPFYLAESRNLSDDGLKMLDLLPQEQLIVALREVKAAAEAPDTPGDERDKREVFDWANKGINLAKNLEWIADKVKDVLKQFPSRYEYLSGLITPPHQGST